jgi:hypothetical protein
VTVKPCRRIMSSPHDRAQSRWRVLRTPPRRIPRRLRHEVQ